MRKRKIYCKIRKHSSDCEKLMRCEIKEKKNEKTYITRFYWKESSIKTKIKNKISLFTIRNYTFSKYAN